MNTLEVFTQTQSISSKAFLPPNTVAGRADLGRMSRRGYDQDNASFPGFPSIGWVEERKTSSCLDQQLFDSESYLCERGWVGSVFVVPSALKEQGSFTQKGECPAAEVLELQFEVKTEPQ